jgi:parvulin-like peptidyl-prolyl isomerase
MTDYLQRGTIGDFATEEIIFNMKPGEVSDVIPYVQRTWLIVKMIDKKKVKSTVSYDDYRDAIYNHLLSKKYQDFLIQYVDSLKMHYTITIDLSPLK